MENKDTVKEEEKENKYNNNMNSQKYLLLWQQV